VSTNSDFKPARAEKSSIRTDLPLLVVPRAGKRKIGDMTRPGQLVCIGTVYMKTHKGVIRIKAA